METRDVHLPAYVMTLLDEYKELFIAEQRREFRGERESFGKITNTKKRMNEIQTFIGEVVSVSFNFDENEISSCTDDKTVMLKIKIGGRLDSFPDILGSRVTHGYLEKFNDSTEPYGISPFEELHIHLRKHAHPDCVLRRMAELISQHPHLQYEFRLAHAEFLERLVSDVSPDGLGHVYHIIRSEDKDFHQVLHLLERGMFGDEYSGFFREELLKIYATLCEMDKAGNTGWYSGDLPGPAGGWLEREDRYKMIRKATMFWRVGWGWRLRKKKPAHWRDAFTKLTLWPDGATS